MSIKIGQRPPAKADVVIAGTGFAATFFLHELLANARPDIKVVVLERGKFRDHKTLIEGRLNNHDSADYYRPSGDPEKIWKFFVGFGGGSNCWWGNTPRMLPADFETRSRFGKGIDWPFGYDELEPFYTQAERLMAIAGMASPHFPMSENYPLPPHRPALPDVLLAKAWPGLHGPMPTARASRPTGTRPPCCANGVCDLCPIEAKFTVLSDMMSVYEDPRVDVYVGMEVTAVETEGGRASGFEWRGPNDESGVLMGEHMVLATNALFNAAILQNSGDESPLVGRQLHEQIGLTARIYLDGLDSFQGGTSVTGLGLHLYADEERRKNMAAALLEINNTDAMRRQPGRWRQIQHVRLVYEDLPQENNMVRLGNSEDQRVVAHYEGPSDYTLRAIKQAPDDLARIFASMPVEEIVIVRTEPTESHIQGTTVMGADPATSVCDPDGLHHRWRDLRVLGSSLFPTCPAANPTLTLAAHALRAANRMEAI